MICFICNCDKRAIQAVLFKIIFYLTLGAAVGCSSLPNRSNDAALGPTAKSYLEGVSLISANEARSAKCEGPTKEESQLKSSIHHSKNWKGLVERAQACVLEKDWKILEDLATVMARLDLNSPWGAYFLSLSAEAKGDLPRAMWMVDLALKKAGHDYALFNYQRGRIFVAMKDTSRGLVEIERAAAADPTLVEANYYLGTVYHRDGESDRAEKHYRAVLSVDSRHFFAMVNLAEIRLQSDDSKEAAQLFSKAVAQHPQQLHTWIRLAHVYESVQKNPQAALDTYKGLRAKIDAGALAEKPDFDLNQRIRTLEATLEAQRLPAQVSVDSKQENRSVK